MVKENIESLKRMLKAILFVFIFGHVLIASGQDKPIESSLTAKKTIEKSLPKLLDLGAKKCVPCKKMAPILVELAREYQGVFDVEFVDVWQSENRERALNHKVSAIPTQIFFDSSGKELWRHVGFMSKTDMLQKWKDLGFKFKPTPKNSTSDSAGPS